RVDEYAHHADTDATRRDLTEHHVRHRCQTTEWREAIVHAVDAAVRCPGRRARPQPATGRTKPDLLALHVAAGLGGRHRLVDAERGEARIAVLLGKHGDEREDDPDDRHCRQQDATLTAILHEVAEGDRERERDLQDQI